ncbi:MAG TPA: hypothetical protein VMU25_01600 [Candidatus Paceibacterota bacterium]|nr:hypothetical protein [Candidatus Paceibacterota bacterium]
MSEIHIRIRKTTLNRLLTLVLVLGIAFSFANIVRATTPNPGHSSTEIDFQEVTKTSTTTLATTDTVVMADATSNSFTLTLPDSTANPDLIFWIKKIDLSLTNIVTVAGAGTDTIDGLSNITLANRGETVMLQSNGSGTWRVLSRRSYDVSGYRAKGSTLNQWYSSPNSGTALTTGSPTVNKLYAIPFVVSKATTIDQMAINVTTVGSGGTGNERVGIYNDNGNDYPGTLVVDAGAAGTTGSTGVKTFTTGLPVTLDPGLYWLVTVHDNSTTAPTLRCFAVASLTPILGYASSLPTNAQFGWTVSFTYAALPSNFPSGGSAITGVPIPSIFVRTSQ